MRLRIELALVSAFSMVLLIWSPANASATERFSGILTTPSGAPISGVDVNIYSGGDGDMNTTLTTTVTSSRSGSFTFVAYPGTARIYLEAKDLRGNAHGVTLTSGVSLHLYMAERKSYTVHFISETGEPVIGAKLKPDFYGLYVHPQSVDGVSVCTYDGQHGNHDPTVSNSNGNATIDAFEIEPGTQPECARLQTFNIDMPTDYEALPGVHLTPTVPFNDWSDGDATVVLDSVPSLLVDAPGIAKKSKFITIKSRINPNFPSTTVSQGRKKFKGKKVVLYSQDFSNPASPGKWKKVGSKKGLSKTGAVKFRVKFKRATRYQIRPVNFALASPRITVLTK